MADPAQNPIYLHASDHPGLVLVSQPLADDNYASWKRSMILAPYSLARINWVLLTDPYHNNRKMMFIIVLGIIIATLLLPVFSIPLPRRLQRVSYTQTPQ